MVELLRRPHGLYMLSRQLDLVSNVEVRLNTVLICLLDYPYLGLSNVRFSELLSVLDSRRDVNGFSMQYAIAS